MAREYVLVGREGKYPYTVTNIGLAMMEKETGLKLPGLLSMISEVQAKQADGANMIEVAAIMKIGLFEVMALMYAGLEGHRLKFRTKETPWTLDEVSDVLDDCGGMAGVQEVMNEALSEFWPKLLGTVEPQRSAPPAKKTRTRKTSQRRSKSSSVKR